MLHNSTPRSELRFSELEAGDIGSQLARVVGLAADRVTLAPFETVGHGNAMDWYGMSLGSYPVFSGLAQRKARPLLLCRGLECLYS